MKKFLDNLPPTYYDLRTGERGAWVVWMEHSPHHLAVDANGISQVQWQFRIEIKEQK